MIIELKKDVDKIRVGDAIVCKSGKIRIIVETDDGYGAYAPESNRIHYSNSKSIEYLIQTYYHSSIDRIIKSDKLRLIEM